MSDHNKNLTQETYHQSLSENDMELVAAYAENRLNRKMERIMRKRLNEEPALRQSLSGLVISARETEYQKILQKNLETDRNNSGVLKRASEFFIDCFRIPAWRNTGFVTAVLLMLVIYSVYHKNKVPPSKDMPIHIQLMASVDKMPKQDIRSRSNSEVFELRPGESLNSSSYYKIYINTEKNAYVNVWIHDSSGEMTELFSGKSGSEMPLEISDGADGFQLDKHPGIETIHVLTSTSKIKNREQMAVLLQDGKMDQFNKLFPGILHQIFEFTHE